MNGHRGRVTLRGEGGEFVLAFSLNAMCALEEALGAPLADLGPRLDQPSAADLRAMLWAMLRDHHPDLTLDDAGRLAPVAVVSDAVARAIAAAQPEAAGPRPPEASRSRP